jgi:hypothetical protein
MARFAFGKNFREKFVFEDKGTSMYLLDMITRLVQMLLQAATEEIGHELPKIRQGFEQ